VPTGTLRNRRPITAIRTVPITGRFYPRWVLAVTLGETLGFAVPAAVGGILTLWAAPTALVYAATVVAGAVEGALLGLGQWIGFGVSRPVPRGAWIAVTAVGAACAWSIGMLPSTFDGIDFGSPLLVALVVFGGLVLLGSIPTLQWLVLRRSVRPSWWWVPASMGGWAAGILWTAMPSPFIDEQTPALAIFVSYLGAGLLMAATVAVLTGFAARRLVRPPASHAAARGEPAPIPPRCRT
jgi:hypothetical protein